MEHVSVGVKEKEGMSLAMKAEHVHKKQVTTQYNTHKTSSRWSEDGNYHTKVFEGRKRRSGVADEHGGKIE